MHWDGLIRRLGFFLKIENARNYTEPKGSGRSRHSDSPVDMDIACSCELSLSIDHEPTSFKEATSHDEWKEAKIGRAHV